MGRDCSALRVGVCVEYSGKAKPSPADAAAPVLVAMSGGNCELSERAEASTALASAHVEQHLASSQKKSSWVFRFFSIDS